MPTDQPRSGTDLDDDDGPSIWLLLQMFVQRLSSLSAVFRAVGTQRARPTSLILASQATLGLLVALTAGMLVMKMRDAALIGAEHELRSLSLILADQAERAFEAVDVVQTTFLDMARDRIRTPTTSAGACRG